MSLPLKIALRYLFSHKQHNAVNIISMISVGGVAVASMAMVIVLSIFNGFESLSERQLSQLAPPLQVTPKTGNVIANADSVADIISHTSGVSAVEPILSHQALAAVDNVQVPVNIIGVSDTYPERTHLSDVIVDGDETITADSTFNYAVLSAGVAIDLNIRPQAYKFVDIYVPRREGRINTANASNSFRSESFVASGVYQLMHDTYDTDIILLPIKRVRELLDFDSIVATAINVYTDDAEATQPLIQQSLSDYDVKNRIQQEEASFKMISIEKWVTFLMLTFILIIASFNIISTISILIIDKEPNMAILSAMGATKSMIKRIFIYQGWLISVAGGIIGIALGVVLSLIQQYFGIIGLSASSSANLSVDAYPVVVSLADILIVAGVIIVTGTITAFVAVRR